MAATEWVTFDAAKEAVGLPPTDTSDDAWLTRVVAAVNQHVDDTRPTVKPAGGYVVDDKTSLGALNLATRWYSRRNSDAVAAFVESGGAVPPIDRDIEMQLGIGRYAGPVVA